MDTQLSNTQSSPSKSCLTSNTLFLISGLILGALVTWAYLTYFDIPVNVLTPGPI